MQLKWSKDAIEDLDNIWKYIAADNIMRAFSFIDELRVEAKRLADNPMIGIKIPEINDTNFREWFYRDYTLIYEIVGNAVLIHEVHNQKRYFIRSINRE